MLMAGLVAKCLRIAPPGYEQDATLGQKHDAHGQKHDAHGQKHDTHEQKNNFNE